MKQEAKSLQKVKQMWRTVLWHVLPNTFLFIKLFLLLKMDLKTKGKKGSPVPQHFPRSMHLMNIKRINKSKTLSKYRFWSPPLPLLPRLITKKGGEGLGASTFSIFFKVYAYTVKRINKSKTLPLFFFKKRQNSPKYKFFAPSPSKNFCEIFILPPMIS